MDKNDSENDSRPFAKLYQIELEALDAYAAHALIALYEADNTIMNRITQLQEEVAEHRKRKAA